jgi:hypothetical protein
LKSSGLLGLPVSMVSLYNKNIDLKDCEA